MTDRRTQQLFDMLRRVREILAEGRRSLATHDADSWKALALARWDMLRALSRLNRHKQIFLLDPVRMQGSEKLTRRARQLVDSNLGLLERYREFVERWSLTSPSSVGSDYQVEAVRMGDRIERQMAVDGRELDSLLNDSRAVGAGTVAG